ncbi:heterokaryon incompatibility, partial [Mollisia scopiformis]
HRLPYEIISYRWGDSTPTHKVFCNNARCLFTRNLYSALSRIRKADVSRFVWADQISINQDDVDKRNHQVGVMRHIYANAIRTLIWLGDNDAE